MKTGTQGASFVDVTKFFDDSAKQDWKDGRWKGKVTMFKFFPWAEAKAGELGRPLSREDIDGYVASSSSEDLDKPMTGAEIRERFRGAKSLDDLPVTRAALKWLREQTFNSRPANEDRKVWMTMQTRSKNDDLQVTLPVAQGLLETVGQIVEKEQFGPDTTTENYAVGETVNCDHQDAEGEYCGCRLSPKMKTIVKDGRVLTHRDGPLKGKAIRIGAFRTIMGPDGKYAVSVLCPEHQQLWRQNGGYTYPYADAKAIADASNKEEEAKVAAEAKRQRDAEAMRKQAESSPTFAVRQKYHDVRGMVDSGRNRRRRQ